MMWQFYEIVRVFAWSTHPSHAPISHKTWRGTRYYRHLVGRLYIRTTKAFWDRAEAARLAKAVR